MSSEDNKNKSVSLIERLTPPVASHSDILSDASSEFSHNTADVDAGIDDERDEVKEIMKMASKETGRVRTLRCLVNLALFITAIAVTVTTYVLLKLGQYSNFETAYGQFARTVADAALDQQKDFGNAIRSLSHAITTYAEATNVTWPYFYMPNYESLAEDFKAASGSETIGININVRNEERDAFIIFSSENYQQWIKDGHMRAYGNLDLLDTDESKYNRFISRKGADGFVPDIDRDMYYVRTQLSPPPRAYGPVTNWNVGANASNPSLKYALELAAEWGNETVIGEVRPFRGLPLDEHLGLHSHDNVDNPHSFAYYAIHESLANHVYDRKYDSKVVATLAAGIAWDASLRNLLPDNVRGIFCVIRNTCNQEFSYYIDGKEAIYKGDGDHHETSYDDMEVAVNLALFSHPNFTKSTDHCMYSMSIYPSSTFQNEYATSEPEKFAVVVAAFFALVTLTFFVYDITVQIRNTKLINNAASTSAIVTSLFPEEIRNRLIDQKQDNNILRNSMKQQSSESDIKNLKSCHEEEACDIVTTFTTDPIADLIPETTVIFADIVGFTAWSSTREPTQVFKLLETLFCVFDKIAKRRRVFKVETVGDCYVAVCGLPRPRSDHAIAAVRFSRNIINAMRNLTRTLEVILGPDTADLALRLGIHSGPVTAGVLRGDRSRFQLFGDTVNTAARIESTGASGRIHLSEETAKLLFKAGKEGWIRKREDKVSAKGKGDIQTYWVKLHDNADDSSFGNISVDGDEIELNDDWNTQINSNRDNDRILPKNERNHRLIDWNVEMLLRLIRQIVARREALFESMDEAVPLKQHPADKIDVEKASMPLEEVKEIISLPTFDSRIAKLQKDPEKVVLPPAVISQLRDYVTCIANRYRDNPFHSFAHASHVVMSVIKLMSRIVATSDSKLVDENDENPTVANDKSARKLMAQTLHDHTYGITSDPLTQFACAFSALIHDVDHAGVPNPQLIKEQPELAVRYNSRSVAEQNSLDLAWESLMENQYSDLRHTLCCDKAELTRFRQLCVNSVMATDIADKELKALRNGRWDKAFKKDIPKKNGLQREQAIVGKEVNDFDGDDDSLEAVNRKATIVIEHIIQASDVSHTMQHWHIYRKWNEKLFNEIYEAFLLGRCDTDPSETWYKGEIGFFDFYIIPLAKKLKNCGVFGVCSDEYLNYAITNREEWEQRGQDVVAEMLEKIKEQGNEKD